MRPVCLPEKYEILGELGCGGMGVVYHARDRILDREVALKVLAERFAADPRFAERFLAEARTAASLNHPNIVQIYEFGETGSDRFLAMELVRGTTLAKLLRTAGSFSEDRSLDLALAACRALAVAHAAGVVHRDVKPDNLMLTEDGVLKLVDLGLAKCTQEDVSRTATGQCLGTPHFIAPEQIKGERVVDGRADIYSLGATLYNLATGHVPFDGSSGAHIMARHLNDPLPDPRRTAPALSTGFCQVLGRMMAKDPADRYPDMPALERDLRALRGGGLPESSRPVPTALQDTVFTPSPAQGLAPERIEAVTVRLAEHVGPLARVLVRQAAAGAVDVRDLVEKLAAGIPDPAPRDAFRAACRGLDGGGTSVFAASDSATLPLSAVGHAPPPAHPADLALKEEEAERITRLLTDRIGPVAGTLVRRERKRARDRRDLVRRLADAIPDAAARRSFLDGLEATA